MPAIQVPPPVRRSLDHLQQQGREAWKRIGQRLRRVRPAKSEPEAASNRPIVLIHGLNMPRQIMSLLAWRLRRKYRRPCYNLAYPGFRSDIPTTAAHVAASIRQLGLQEFDAVTHSLGGVVLRWAVSNHELKGLRRVVMIAPPNGGSWLADRLATGLGPLFPILFGQEGLQLRRGHRGVLAHAGTLPGCEVGVIAGGVGNPKGVGNWFRIPGDCDGTVAVNETILPGMKDFAMVPSQHTMLLASSETTRLVDHFLTHGVFRHRRTASH